MMYKTLRRKVIIREYDFERVKVQAFKPLGLKNSLYDRAEFVPFNTAELEKENMICLLKDKENPFRPTEIPQTFLFNVKDYLYNSNYVTWNSEYDDKGYIWIQARKNTPKSILGWGIFEKDLLSRINGRTRK